MVGALGGGGGCGWGGGGGGEGGGGGGGGGGWGGGGIDVRGEGKRQVPESRCQMTMLYISTTNFDQYTGLFFVLDRRKRLILYVASEELPLAMAIE